MEYINQAEIVVFHEGSSIIQAVALNYKFVWKFWVTILIKDEMYSNLLNLKI